MLPKLIPLDLNENVSNSKTGSIVKLLAHVILYVNSVSGQSDKNEVKLTENWLELYLDLKILSDDTLSSLHMFLVWVV